jgi:hypothetical protein
VSFGVFVTGKPLQSFTLQSPGSNVAFHEVPSGPMSLSQARLNGCLMWLAGLSLLMSPSTISHPRAAAAVRHFRGHRFLRVFFKDILVFMRPEPLNT